MATMEARLEAKPEPKEIEESYEPLLKYKRFNTQFITLMGSKEAVGDGEGEGCST
ncbi:hypothetical protein C1H46_035630 [Malus baccata]|uniref:Uncharacterized protein n=1 Tax=Malus baccata TaxID=106549 RepID=A0A540KX53_MALBA|nr:hypothetical protein C1H46_035630 [Malus baccata]